MASTDTIRTNNPYSDLTKRTNNKGVIDYSGLQPGQSFDLRGNIQGPSQGYVSQTNTGVPAAGQSNARVLGPNPSATDKAVVNAALPVPGSAASAGILAAQPGDVERQRAIDNLLRINQAQADQSVNPDQIYQDQLRQFQEQINASNAVYNDMLNKARVEGQGRVESAQFAQGRYGQIGSGTGASQISSINQANAGVEQGIQAQRLAEIASILSQVRNTSKAELEAKTAAKRQGAEALVNYYTVEAPKFRANKAATLARALLAKGLDINTLSQQDLLESGLTLDELLSAYRTEELSQAKIQAEVEKLKKEAAGTDDEGFTLSAGQARYVLNPETGEYELAASVDPKVDEPDLPASAKEYNFAVSQGYTGSYQDYQNEDANRKRTVVNNIAQGSNLNTKEAAVFNSLVDKYSKSPLVAANDRAITLKSSINSLRNDPKNSANQVAFIYSLIQALDTYQSAVREGEIGLVSSTQGISDKISNLPAKIQGGSIMSTDTVNRYLKVAEDVTAAIQAGADAKARAFQAQANINSADVGEAFSAYTGTAQGTTSSSNDPMGIR